MKSPLILSILALFTATSTFAAPKVGDSASMDGMIVGTGMSAKVTAVQKITAFNANTGVYTILQTKSIGADVQSQEVQVTADDMITDEDGAMIVAYCESKSIGKTEKITVAAGTFDTCRVTNANGSILWVAGVPFGVVKLQTTVNIGTVTLGASGFARGQ